MGRKKKKKKVKDVNKKAGLFSTLKKETIEGIIAILMMMLAVFLLLSPFGKAGVVGNFIYTLFDQLLGAGYYLVPLVFVFMGISFMKSEEKDITWPKIVGAIVFILSGIIFLDLTFDGGGLLGSLISAPLIKLFDYWVSLIIVLGGLIISFFIIFDTSIKLSSIMNLFKKKELEEGDENEEELDVDINQGEDSLEDDDEEVEVKKVETPAEETKEHPEKDASGLIFFSKNTGSGADYKSPPLSLLNKDSGKPVVGDIKANANIIKRTLANFGIRVEMDEISIGPSVTRYALKPAEGVRLAKLASLQNDLALALAAHPLRIEAPIPGKSLVGIEIPNKVKTKVGLGTLLKHSDYQESPKPLTLALGKGVTGKSYYTDLGKAPHMLIAGATGSGKSVTIHTLITSMLYKNSPEMLKFIMIDPKRVELTLYNKIPHLLTPVITDAKKAILSLKWAAKEMNRRYDILQEHEVRDISSYHKNIVDPALAKAEKTGDKENLPETMPFIVIVIDELADIMQTYPRELEAGIVRLAQMSRAVGIHLIISTQRPSVNVITGLIKANIPTRIALQVASQIDSRTILDMPGAEKLLGQGDMLFLGGEMSQPHRIQSAFISEEEVKNVVKHLVQQYNDELPETEIDLEGVNDKVSIFDAVNSDDEEDGDDLYGEAKEVVISAGKASTSYLQRKLGIGYSRAAKIIDILEEKGIIGPANGSKPREILIGDDSEGNEDVAE